MNFNWFAVARISAACLAGALAIVLVEVCLLSILGHAAEFVK